MVHKTIRKTMANNDLNMKTGYVKWLTHDMVFQT